MKEAMKELKVAKKITTATPAFIFLSVFYASLLIVSNITVVKLVRVGPFLLTAAFFTYPLVYVISDIMTEIYGYRLSMKAIWANFSAQAMIALILSLTLRLRGIDDSIQGAMSVLFSTTLRIVAGSLAAYWVGDWLNSLVMSKMKVAQKGRRFFIRAMASSIPAHFIDTAIFTAIASRGAGPRKTSSGISFRKACSLPSTNSSPFPSPISRSAGGRKGNTSMCTMRESVTAHSEHLGIGNIRYSPPNR